MHGVYHIIFMILRKNLRNNLCWYSSAGRLPARGRHPPQHDDPTRTWHELFREELFWKVGAGEDCWRHHGLSCTSITHFV